MDRFMVLITGPPGSGKSTIGKLVHKQVKNTAHIGVDRIKWFVSDFKRSPKQNAVARSVCMSMCKEYVAQGVNLLITQGLYKEKLVEPFIQLAKKNKMSVFVYQFSAPDRVLLKRVAKRQPHPLVRIPLPKKTTMRNIANWRSNRYSLGTSIDTSKVGKKEIVRIILSDIKKKVR
jgi:shikimate kinase